ncbi:malate dehydrogenase [Psychromonas antarctica]|jgi:malate dehydrogenase|uniref:malate dehydrogenase n=1 Tax=Psychromonas antarctica TaxID=67573 RepID=UPI001EE98329|nr:malate dehydrogenase [Psychromonas antarctica]MCG6201087.1 malate dehydrogenase [Psychromonas antarctica]
MKVTVLGAAGGIGQALALLLKLDLPENSSLSLYDIAAVTPGVAKDLSHIPTSVKVEGYAGDDPSPALEGADVVLICAGVARKPGMDRSDLFNINASIIFKLVAKVAEVAPEACIGIITNPVNTTVAIASEVLKKAGVYNKNKLFGITTLDVIRAEDFVAEKTGLPAEHVRVNVIGGHSGTTILPVLSQVQGVHFSDQEVIELTERIQNAGTEVVEAKAGGGSATLSMARAASIFGVNLVQALLGKQGIIQNAYVDGGNACSPFFTQPLLLGKNGIERVLPFGELSPFEEQKKQEMLSVLHADIQKGIDFVLNKDE